MSRHLLLASLLIVVSTSAMSSDLKPGQWEIIQSMSGDQMPEQMTQETTETQCMTAEESSDMIATLREDWTSSGCEDIKIRRDGDTIDAQATCPAGARTTTFDASITMHSDEHFNSMIEMDNGQQVTIEQEGHWVGENCES